MTHLMLGGFWLYHQQILLTSTYAVDLVIEKLNTEKDSVINGGGMLQLCMIYRFSGKSVPVESNQ